MINRIFNDKYLFDRMVYACIAIIIVVRWWQKVMLHNFHEPEVLTPIINNTHWLLMLLGIPQFFSGQEWAALLVDIGLLVIPISLILIPKMKMLRIGLFLLVFVYITTLQCIMAFQGHSLYGILIMSFILMFRYNNSHFNLMRGAARYYACFIFVSSGLWKLVRGHVWDPDQFSNILKYQHASLLFYQPANWMNNIYLFLMENPNVAQAVLFAGLLVQLSLIIGFFTRKYDGLLFGAIILFLVGNLVIMNISFMSLSVLLLLFVRREWGKVLIPNRHRHFSFHG